MIADVEAYRLRLTEMAVESGTIMITAVYVEPQVVAFPDGSSVVRRKVDERSDGLRWHYEYTIHETGLAVDWVEADKARIARFVASMEVS